MTNTLPEIVIDTKNGLDANKKYTIGEYHTILLNNACDEPYLLKAMAKAKVDLNEEDFKELQFIFYCELVDYFFVLRTLKKVVDKNCPISHIQASTILTKKFSDDLHRYMGLDYCIGKHDGYSELE